MFNINMKAVPGAVRCSPVSLLKCPAVPSSGQYVTCCVFFNKGESSVLSNTNAKMAGLQSASPNLTTPHPSNLRYSFLCYRHGNMVFVGGAAFNIRGRGCCFPSLLGSICCRCGLQAIDSAVEAPSMNKACCLRR